MYSIPVEQLPRYSPLFRGCRLEMLINAIIAGNAPAALWTSGAGTPTALLLWDRGNNIIYLTCSGEGVDIVGLTGVVENHVLKYARPGADLKARGLTEWGAAALPGLFGNRPASHRETFFYRLNGSPVPGVNPPSGVTILPITRESVENIDPVSAGVIREEVSAMWGSQDRFFEHGFGAMALAGGNLVCLCTAEYVSASMCGVGIATEASFRRRGVATAVSLFFVKMARERQVTPFWECAEANLPSVRLAEKIGFHLIERETYLVYPAVPSQP